MDSGAGGMKSEGLDGEVARGGESDGSGCLSWEELGEIILSEEAPLPCASTVIPIHRGPDELRVYRR